MVTPGDLIELADAWVKDAETIAGELDDASDLQDRAAMAARADVCRYFASQLRAMAKEAELPPLDTPAAELAVMADCLRLIEPLPRTVQIRVSGWLFQHAREGA